MVQVDQSESDAAVRGRKEGVRGRKGGRKDGRRTREGEREQEGRQGRKEAEARRGKNPEFSLCKFNNKVTGPQPVPVSYIDQIL
eukprot:3934990-Rhodomonas_salina.2